jgi:hypothetical protein
MPQALYAKTRRAIDTPEASAGSFRQGTSGTGERGCDPEPIPELLGAEASQTWIKRAKPQDKKRCQIPGIVASGFVLEKSFPGLPQLPAVGAASVSGRTKLALALESQTTKRTKPIRNGETRRSILPVPRTGHAKIWEREKAKAAPPCGISSRGQRAYPFSLPVGFLQEG